MSADTGNRRIHSTGKGSPYPRRLCKVMPRAVSGEIILAGGCGISPENPAQPGYGPFGACGMESPVPVINYNKKRLWT